jgi:hypothetical protein
VFWAVGWPFICRIPQPGRPIMPRTRLRLFTWQAVAVAPVDWYTPWSTVDTSRSAVPTMRAASRTWSAGTPQIPATRSGSYPPNTPAYL